MPINTAWQAGSSRAEGAKSITSSTVIKGKGADQMKMDDFFNLLMAQMTNQDIMNPTDNTQMIAQMAQFSSLQAMSDVSDSMKALSEYNQLSYATGYVGKNVTIATVDKYDKMQEFTGVVEKVTFFDGTPKVYVDGKAYDLHTVMQVNASAESTSASAAADSLQQATSAYLNKYVILTHVDEAGEPHNIEGYVKSVTLKAGQAHVVIDDKSYPANAITDVFFNRETAHPDESGVNGSSAEQGSRDYEELDPNKTYDMSSEELARRAAAAK